jgi:ATP-dependent DNA helicase RecG
VGEYAVVNGTVSRVRSGRGRPSRSLDVLVQDDSGTLVATWFQPPKYLASFFVSGRPIVLMGTAQRRAGGIAMLHPEYEDAGRQPSVHRGRVAPVYATTDGLGARALRGYVAQAFEAFGDLPEVTPAGLRQSLGLPSRTEALRQIHFPEAADDIPSLLAGSHPAHAALLWEDLFVLHTALLRRRHLLPPGPPTGPSGGLVDRLRGELSFELTGAQGRALAALRRDTARPRPMQRLLQGDVGSGKTIVGLLTAAATIDRGGQAAILAPTEVLAKQWVHRARALLAPHGISVAYLVGGQSTSERGETLEAVSTGRAGLIVGTHAILGDSVSFADLRLVVVDEQQRFGVFQRSRLLQKGHSPHLLAMTATPIPRTLALTQFGDLDITVLDERPPRGRVKTEVFGPQQRAEAYRILGAEVAAGGRGFVVCPRVDGRGAGRAVLPTAEELAVGPLEGVRLGVLHGQMANEAKATVLDAFRGGQIQVLVTTTVIEVGVDVPEATVLLVEDAERFGLAQLHQLRGRIGRSRQDGRCVLVRGVIAPVERLDVLADTDDGFRVAEEDLRGRGAGDLVGARQAGTPAFRLSISPRFAELAVSARAVAASVVARADWETAPELAPLRARVRGRLNEDSASGG